MFANVRSDGEHSRFTEPHRMPANLTNNKEPKRL